MPPGLRTSFRILRVTAQEDRVLYSGVLNRRARSWLKSVVSVDNDKAIDRILNASRGAIEARAVITRDYSPGRRRVTAGANRRFRAAIARFPIS
jgi:hypothetical protein